VIRVPGLLALTLLGVFRLLAPLGDERVALAPGMTQALSV
jgi:hypothetical protein